MLDYWNAHKWLPGDPSYLLDMLHSYARDRLVIDKGQVRAARSIISPAEAVAASRQPRQRDMTEQPGAFNLPSYDRLVS